VTAEIARNPCGGISAIVNLGPFTDPRAPDARRRNARAKAEDQRTASAYIFGAICPARGEGAGLVLPRCTTEGMSLHLKEIAQVVAPDAHAVVLVRIGDIRSGKSHDGLLPVKRLISAGKNTAKAMKNARSDSATAL
jgi:hypothetical protein